MGAPTRELALKQAAEETFGASPSDDQPVFPEDPFLVDFETQMRLELGAPLADKPTPEDENMYDQMARYFGVLEARRHSDEEEEFSPLRVSGGSNSYYELPKGAAELADLIEHKRMNFNVGNIFKAAYRLGDKPGNSRVYDLEKIIWFAQRELARERKMAE